MQQRSVAFHTLGCKLNFSETSTLSRQLGKDGFVEKSFDEKADIYVINTCSVTENADKECRQIVRKIQRKSPESLVVITGCYAQLKPDEIASIPGVDLVLGAAEKFNISKHLAELSKGDSALISSCDIEQVSDFVSSYSLNHRTRAFLKVQDGCNYNCSFCTIPLARGKSRSDTVSNAILNAKTLAAKGVKEIVLTGVNLGDFRSDEGHNDSKQDFFYLARQMDEVKGIERFRISSIEPNLLHDEIIDWVAQSKKFMPHFHVPLQSGSNFILGKMKRRYRRELYAEKVYRIKERMPHACIGVDVIVGFPGETDQYFEESRTFIQDLPISYLHVFTYSERKETAAISMPGVIPLSIRHKRNKVLRSLSYEKMQAFTARHSSTERKVLFEQAEKGGFMEGYTDNYIRVSAPYRAEWVNEIVPWII
jgi:threonylcarbamoyladenosine tRNA methylthiotransferase MtaB